MWELDSNKVDLVSVQTATLLNLIYSHNGMDKIGQPYLMQALKVAQQLDLFGDHANEKNERMIHARVFTAWALFNWQWYVDSRRTSFVTFSDSSRLSRLLSLIRWSIS